MWNVDFICRSNPHALFFMSQPKTITSSKPRRQTKTVSSRTEHMPDEQQTDAVYSVNTAAALNIINLMS